MENHKQLKRIVFAIATTMLVMNAFAQQGCFIHKVYEPLEVELQIGMRYDFDITGDSIPEFYFEQSHVAIESSTLNGWMCCCYNPNHPGGSCVFNDMLACFDDESLTWGNSFIPYLTTGPNFPAVYECKEAMRLQLGEDYYYGWWEGTVVWEQNSNPVLTYRESCYCTIPNYPLHFGQTDFTWDVDENEFTVFATLHPNPTTGQVTIMGHDLKAAEAFNAIGQCVAAAKGKGEQIIVDLRGLPAGVYLVNITDGEGRKCVKKVVKE